MDIAAARPKAKYERGPRLEVAAGDQRFMVCIYVSATLPTADEPHVPTAFGDLCFRLLPQSTSLSALTTGAAAGQPLQPAAILLVLAFVMFVGTVRSPSGSNRSTSR